MVGERAGETLGLKLRRLAYMPTASQNCSCPHIYSAKNSSYWFKRRNPVMPHVPKVTKWGRPYGHYNAYRKAPTPMTYNPRCGKPFFLRTAHCRNLGYLAVWGPRFAPWGSHYDMDSPDLKLSGTQPTTQDSPALEGQSRV